MKRVGIALAVVMLAVGLAGPAWAVPPGFTLEFDGNGEGKVTFTGDRASRVPACIARTATWSCST